MKSLKYIVIILAASLLLVACGGGSPKSVAAKFLNALRGYDVETVKKYSSPYIKSLVDSSIAKLSNEEFERKRNEAKAMNVNVIDAKIEENGLSATVTYEILDANGNNIEKGKLMLAKEKGDWKVGDF